MNKYHGWMMYKLNEIQSFVLGCPPSQTKQSHVLPRGRGRMLRVLRVNQVNMLCEV